MPRVPERPPKSHIATITLPFVSFVPSWCTLWFDFLVVAMRSTDLQGVAAAGFHYKYIPPIARSSQGWQGFPGIRG